MRVHSGVVRCVAVLIGLGAAIADAHATTISLHDFFATPSVAVSPDGRSARLAEDGAFGVALLSNDPVLGDPEVIVPGPGASFSFDYRFQEDADQAERDEFSAFLFNSDTNLRIGEAYELVARDSGFGSISYDLTVLVGQRLGVQFQLFSLPGDGGANSIADISNLKLQATRAVPEPPPWSLVIVGAALIGLKLRLRAVPNLPGNT